MPTVSISDIVTFDDEVVPTTKIEQVEDAIGFFDSIFPHKTFVVFRDILALSDKITIGVGATFVRPLDESIIFSEEMVVGRYNVSLDDFLYVYDWLHLPLATDLFEVLTLSDEMVAWGGPALLDTIDFSAEEILISLVTTTILSEEVDLIDAFTIYFNDPWTPSGPIPEEQSCV